MPPTAFPATQSLRYLRLIPTEGNHSYTGAEYERQDQDRYARTPRVEEHILVRLIGSQTESLLWHPRRARDHAGIKAGDITKRRLEVP